MQVHVSYKHTPCNSKFLDLVYICMYIHCIMYLYNIVYTLHGIEGSFFSSLMKILEKFKNSMFRAGTKSDFTNAKATT